MHKKLKSSLSAIEQRLPLETMSSTVGNRKFPKIRARKWQRSESSSDDGAGEDHGSDSDWSHDLEGQAPYNGSSSTPTAAIVVRGSRAQPAASRPAASSTRAKNWAALRLNVRMASKLNGLARAEKQRMESIEKANNLYSRRVDDHLRTTHTKLAMSVAPNRRQSNSAAKLRHVGRFTDSGVAVASDAHEQPGKFFALDLLLPHHHQSAKKLLDGEAPEAGSGAGGNGRGGAAAAAGGGGGGRDADEEDDEDDVQSESDDATKARRHPKARRAEERQASPPKKTAPRAKRLSMKHKKGPAARATGPTTSKLRTAHSREDDDGDAGVGDGGASKGKGQSEVAGGNAASRPRPKHHKSLSMKDAAALVKSQNHAKRREEKAALRAREEREAEVELASARDREFRERQRRAVEHKSRQMMANKRASFRVVEGEDDGRFRQAQRDDHLETPEFLTNLLGAPVHKQAEEEKKKKQQQQQQQRQQPTQPPKEVSGGSENSSGDASRHSDLEESAESSKPAERLTKKQIREAERKAKLEAKAKAKRDRQARADAAAASAARDAEEKAEATAKERAERDAEQAEIDGVQWNDNWSDDGGFEVDQQLLDLAGFESNSEEDDEEAQQDDDSTSSHGAPSTTDSQKGSPTATGNARSNHEGFTAADKRLKDRRASEAFRRYEQRAELPAIVPVASSSPQADLGALLLSRQSAPLPPPPRRFSSSAVLTSGKSKPRRLHRAESNLLRLERENKEAVANVFREMMEAKHKIVVSVTPTGHEQSVSKRIVSQMHKHLRRQRLDRPNPIYRTKQKLLPLVMQLGR